MKNLWEKAVVCMNEGVLLPALLWTLLVFIGWYLLSILLS